MTTEMDLPLPPITDHFDGFGLNDNLHIERDARDPLAGNSSHHYKLVLADEDADGIVNPVTVGFVQFQHGPRHEEGSTPGITSAALLAVLLDHYRGFQSGPLRCRENALVITKLEEALLWMKKRAFDRAAQDVLGKNEKHTERI